MGDEIEKSYFTIGEAAQMIGESPSLLRFWEKEFSKFLRPDKSKGGTRKYHTKDIQTLKLIHYYVKKRGYTLKGAKEALEIEVAPDKTSTILMKLESVKEFLTIIRNNLPKD